MSNVRVLIVDDAKFIRERVTKIVNEAFPEYAVDAAINGQEAKELMQRQRYDIILCDWEMPEVSGLELLQWTRADQTHQAVPFLMVTSRGERGYVLKAIQAGVNDYLGKPFNAEQLTDKMVKLLAKTGKLSAGMQQRAKALIEQDQARRAARQAGQPAPQEAAKPAANAKGLAQLRTSQGIYRCAIKDLSLQEVLVVVKNEGAIPQVLDQVVVDIEQLSGDNVARVNGFILLVQAQEKKLNSTFINVKVQFVDDDPDKMAHLSKYIASVR